MSLSLDPVTPTLDPAALARLQAVAGDAAFMAELVNTFLSDAPGLLAEMSQALACGDAGALGRVAHSLKSNSRDFGAGALAQLCLELEMLGKTGALDGAAEKCALAEAEFARVKAALEAVL